MTSIRCEETIAVPAPAAWAALRKIGDAHHLFAGVLADCRMEDDVRTVTFVNGMVVRERIVSLDDEVRRLAYAVLSDMFEQHSASMQIVPLDEQRCRFVWISDFLPDGRAEVVEPLMRQGAAAMRRSLEQAVS